MSSAFRSRQPHEALPPEIYLPLVDSLFKEGRTLLIGTFFVIGSVLVTYWKTGEILILYCAIAITLVACARGYMMRAYLRNARDRHHSGNRQALGISLRRRRLGDPRVARHVVLHRLFADQRFLRASRQLFHDDRLCRRHFRTQLCKSAICHCANSLHLGADHGGLGPVRKSVSLDFRGAAHPVILRHQAHRGPVAPNAARRGGHLARHVAARQTV